MADAAENVQAVSELTETINQLHSGAMVFIIIIIMMALIAFVFWLRSRRATSMAEIKRAEIEQKGKQRRSAAHSNSVTEVSTAMYKLQQQTVLTLTEHEDRVISLVSTLKINMDERTSALQDSLSAHGRMLQHLVDVQQGVMNTEDSLRVVEETFTRFVVAECTRIATVSLEKNHYAERKSLIEERVVQALGKTASDALRSLLEFNMSIDPRSFFQRIDGRLAFVDTQPEDFALVSQIWEATKAAHEERLVSGHSDEIVEHTKLKVRRICMKAFTEGKTSALDLGLYYAEATSSDDIPAIRS